MGVLLIILIFYFKMNTETKRTLKLLKEELFKSKEGAEQAYNKLLDALKTSSNLVPDLNAMNFLPYQIALIGDLLDIEHEETETSILKAITILTIRKDIN